MKDTSRERISPEQRAYNERWSGGAPPDELHMFPAAPKPAVLGGPPGAVHPDTARVYATLCKALLGGFVRWQQEPFSELDAALCGAAEQERVVLRLVLAGQPTCGLCHARRERRVLATHYERVSDATAAARGRRLVFYCRDHAYEFRAHGRTIVPRKRHRVYLAAAERAGWTGGDMGPTREALDVED